MGTTVTSNLGLIKPDDNESIKQNLPTYNGWAAQNATNCDAIDALFRASETAPSLAFTAVGGGFTLGAGGFTEFKCLRLFPRMAIVFFRIYMGAAGFAAGTGGYQIAGMVPAVDSAFSVFANSGEVAMGKMIFRDDSADLTSGVMPVIYNKTGPSFFFRNVDGTTWSATTPVAVAQQDRASGYFMYPTSDA